MSLAEIKERASALPPDQQAELVAHLVEHLRRDDPEYRQELARSIDDKDPGNWARWSEVKKKPKR